MAEREEGGSSGIAPKPDDANASIASGSLEITPAPSAPSAPAPDPAAVGDDAEPNADASRELPRVTSDAADVMPPPADVIAPTWPAGPKPPTVPPTGALHWSRPSPPPATCHAIE